jgi:hypothetical protein
MNPSTSPPVALSIYVAMLTIETFIFNYGRFAEAMGLYRGFSEAGCKSYLLNCLHPEDPPFQETATILKLPNVYYSGQWNEAIKIATSDVILIVNSDVVVPSPRKLLGKCRRFFVDYGEHAGIYAPNHFWTPWTYKVHLLPDRGNGLKEVPATDSTIWAVQAAVAHRVGPIDLSVNKLGWGIEVVAAYHCFKEDKLVVRDYSMKLKHPEGSAYDRAKADQEQRAMYRRMGLDTPEFWKYYNSRDRYGFGCGDSGEPAGTTFDKMLL